MAWKGGVLWWRIFGGLSATLAAVVARKLLAKSWKTATGKEPPTNPEHPETSWPEAVGWALFIGAAIGLARLLAAREAAAYWRRATGKLPPGLEQVT
jgi:uncharacterized protein DUF4235